MLYYLGRALFRLFFRLLCRWRVTGVETCPRWGPLILAPNHISYLDPPAAGSAVPQPVWFMAKHELFAIPVLGTILPLVNAFPVRRGTADRAALRRAEALLREGKTVVLFPEGMRRFDGRLGDPEPGVAFVALRTQAPVVPVALVGTDRALPRHSALPRPARVEARLGPPMTFPDLYHRTADRSALDEASRRIMAALRSLLNDD
jgi:1-acyl-sn-glycerol-3-phosphate acyltransferase